MATTWSGWILDRSGRQEHVPVHADSREEAASVLRSQLAWHIKERELSGLASWGVRDERAGKPQRVMSRSEYVAWSEAAQRIHHGRESAAKKAVA